MAKQSWDYEVSVSAEVSIGLSGAGDDTGEPQGINLRVDSGISDGEFHIRDTPAQRSELSAVLSAVSGFCVAELESCVPGAPAVRVVTCESPVGGEREIEVTQGSKFVNVYVPSDRMSALAADTAVLLELS